LPAARQGISIHLDYRAYVGTPSAGHKGFRAVSNHVYKLLKNLVIIVLIVCLMEKAYAEPLFQSNSPSVLSINGFAVQALKVACDEFIAGGKDLSGFTITISRQTEKNKIDTNDIFVVTFMGNLTSGTRGLGTANRVPGSITYFISSEKWDIVKEQGVK